ncbi:hypothetical protein [Bailinhaonella thermotolerans]|uniref:Lipoprotein n=1 Tax=Bailinhaonella thermotolerans TaxID=1070861 RepID=A0A3A4AV92_9ACTN|nr:hypothetical protein [Bailinhaonella thermotolerans]RJL34150.1 hypothetical protein D5H75_06625 [Bailinhaonella thermotolerans]
MRKILVRPGLLLAGAALMLPLAACGGEGKPDGDLAACLQATKVVSDAGGRLDKLGEDPAGFEKFVTDLDAAFGEAAKKAEDPALRKTLEDLVTPPKSYEAEAMAGWLGGDFVKMTEKFEAACG